MMILDVLDLAEKFEIQGYEFYNSKKNEVKNSIAKEVFEFLAKMENEHIEYVRRLKKNLQENSTIPRISDDNSNNNTEDFFESRLESQKLIETSRESDIIDLSILRMALLIERDFVDYYSKAAENAESEEFKTIFESFKKWEEGHVKLIEELIEKILEKNRLDLGFYPL